MTSHVSEYFLPFSLFLTFHLSDPLIFSNYQMVTRFLVNEVFRDLFNEVLLKDSAINGLISKLAYILFLCNSFGLSFQK